MSEIKPKKERRFLKTLGRVGEILVEQVLLKLGSSIIKKIGGKKTLPSILFLLASLSLFAQFPNTLNKQRLGFQTTADGLTWRGSISDTASIQPINNQNAWVILDTINLKFYTFDFTSNVWNLVGGDAFTQPVDSLFFNVNVPTNNVDTAKMRWDSDLETVVLGLNDNVPNEIGFKNFWLVKNQTGSTITKGSLVYANGTVGASGRITVDKFIANGSIDAKYLLGITAHDLTDGEDGYVISFGKIRQVNTDTFAAGAILYPSPTVAGVWTDVEPVAPNINMPIGFCINSSSNNGTMAIRVASGYKLSELHDVSITSPLEKASLYYSGGLWRDTTAALLVSDTASMLTPYFRDADTSLLNLTSRFAAKQNNLTNPVTGTGISSFLPRFTGTSTLDSTRLFYSSGRLGVNMDASEAANHLTSRFVIRDFGNNFKFDGSAAGSGYTTTFSHDDTGLKIGHSSNIRDIRFTLNGTSGLTIANNNNSPARAVGIGNDSPSHQLDVTGTFRATGATTLGSTLAVTGDITENGNNVLTSADTSAFARDNQISGTSGQVAYFNSSNSVISDAGLIYNATNKSLGINTTTTSGANLIIKNSQEPVRDTFVGTQTFAADTTNWTRGAGWTFNGTQAVATAATGDLTYTPSLTITSGNAYEITYTLTGYTGGTLSVRLGNGTAIVLPTYNVTGYAVLTLPTASTGGFRFTTSSFTGNLDNVRIMQITGSAPVLLAGQDDGAATLYNSLRMPNSTTLVFGGGGARTTGTNNNFFGSNTGQNNTTGINNNFFGQLAGQFNTTGTGNSFFGTQAGRNNIIGSYNNFFGELAGLGNTTGSANNFFGSNAGVSNLTGGDNNFFGTNSGFANTTGGSNNFFGNLAGRFNLTGIANNFFGSGSGFANTTGGNNNFFGSNAGRSNTTGSSNVAIGNSAMYNTTVGDTLAGSNNIAIGTNAGDNIEFAAAGNVAIGNGIDLPDPSGSNQVVIKNVYFATGASGTGTTIAALSKAGIKTNAPNRDLEVAGEVRITDLTTDTPTRLVGADADGDLGQVTLGAGLSLASSSLLADTSFLVTRFDTASMLTNYLRSGVAASTYLTQSNAASTYLPLTGGTLTGTLNGTNLNLNAGIDVSGNFSTSYNTNVSALFRGYQVLVAPNNDYGSTRIHFSNRPVSESFSNYGSGIRHKWAGSDASNSFLSLYTSNNANLQIDAISIDALGNVGIMDTTPSYTLDVNGTINANQIISTSSGFSGRYFSIRENSANRGGIYPYNVISGSGTDYSINLFSETEISLSPGGSATKKIIISNNGSTSFESPLTVNSSAVFNEGSTDSDFRVESDGNANMVFVDASTDRVGIGYASPTKTLDVNGEVRINTVTATPTSLLGKDGSNVVGEVTTVAQTGLMKSGGTTANTSSVGIITVAHGLSYTPSHVIATISQQNSYVIVCHSKDATNLSFTVYDSVTGNPLNNVSVVFFWLAIK